MKKTAFLISISFAFLFISCDKVGKVCNVSDPLTELSWLTERINELENNATVSKTILKNTKTEKRIDAIAISFNFPLTITNYFNCLGEKICFIGGVAGNQCREYEVIKEEVIYVKPK